MLDPIVIIGLGEMGGVFARGLLRLGHPVFPISRQDDMEHIAASIAQPALVLVAVGENDLHPSLERIPAQWRDRLGLLQNELLPRDWQAHKIPNPTAISVWFEKKKGQDFKVLIPSPIYGPAAEILKDALASLGIPSRIVASEADMAFELVRKNVYILTTNITGLEIGGNVEDLWYRHEELARQVANEVIDIQEWLTGQQYDREALIQGMVEGIQGDLQHKNMGRSAPGRLARALQFADEAGLEVAKLRQIQREFVR